MADAKAAKRYHASVERALALFDATNEWADYIAFLSRLLKSLQDPPANVDIPLKRTIARYLAQCLQPSLPAGVHQKALEVYDLIFSIIGVQGLENNLALYLPGISHTLAFASLATRPQILALYNEHILELSTKIIRPALRALILSLLPGLEEETSEDFENTLLTFTRLREKFVDDGHEELFWQNLFLASITNSHRRAGVLVYLTRQLPKLRPHVLTNTAEISNGLVSVMHPITTPEPGLLVRCFATGLQDEQPLVQRGFLDLLVSHLPLNAEVFVDPRHRLDLDVLVTAATAVVLKRDMSLNRRLWAWFTGSETNTTTLSDQDTAPETPSVSTPLSPKNERLDTGYFSTYALASLIRSLRAMITIPSSDVSLQARPFRVALSLMDRWEIGGPVVESIFVPLIRALQDYQSNAPTQDAFDEVFRSANVFFDGIEGRLIAGQLIKLIEGHEFQLVVFITTNFSLDDSDMTQYHIPLVSLFVAESLRKNIVDQKKNEATSIRHEEALVLANALQDLLELITSSSAEISNALEDSSQLQNWREQILEFYDDNSSRTKSFKFPMSRRAVIELLSHKISETYLNYCAKVSEDGILLNGLTLCVQRLIVLMNDFTALQQLDFSKRLLSGIDAVYPQDSVRFFLAKSTTAIIASLRVRDNTEKALTRQSLCNSVPILVRSLWYFLQASTPQYHIEAVEGIWRLHALVRNDSIVESTILSVLVSHSSAKQVQEQEVLRFSVLWSHSITLSKPFLEAQVGQQASSAELVLNILSPSLWCMLDRNKYDVPTDPVTNWMRSLNTLTPIFRLVLGSDIVSVTDEHILALALERTLKLVHIVKGSPALWESFIKQEDQFGAVRDLCSYLISERVFQENLSLEALSLIKTILDYGHRDLGNDLILLIITQLSETHHIDKFQNALLDTLLAVFPGGDAIPFVEKLLPILLDGIMSPFADAQMDKWVTLLCNIVPLMNLSQLMANLLKITSCLCKRLDKYFSALQDLFGINSNLDVDKLSTKTTGIVAYPERSISNLLAGMEYILARAHQQVLSATQRSETSVNGSVMDLSSSRSSANDRLTVVLCMQDTLKVCVALWLWRSSSRPSQSLIDIRSLNHTSAKLRARSRRILENLIEAEPQECLETLMGLWIENRKSNTQHTHILELLQTLDGARPKYMMPATFNALYSRTNPSALDSSQRSTLSIDINAFELIAFLNDYTNALEDDLLDEIWRDCSTFLREILANPMPHRQILLRMLEFAAVLCRKMDNTNFSDESRMRKELADLCLRLFTAIFTIKPGGLDGQGSRVANAEAVFQRTQVYDNFQSGSGNVLQVICQTLPDISAILTQSDRLIPVYTSIATHITGPMLHSKTFPSNLSAELLSLLQSISTAPSATKAWKKDVTDAFNDGRFFQSPFELVELGWVPLIRQLALIEKTLMPELLSRIVPPATAGLMFGVGATTARIEADKKMSITLRRIAFLLISMETDYFTPYLKQELTKIEELLSATPETSPSSATRSDIYILLRAMLLTHSQAQLAPLWPLIDAELADMCNDMINNSNNNTNTSESIRFTQAAKLQGAKLLDILLLLQPDEFQLHEWLFVTDTVDAIYPPDDSHPNALADQIGALSIENHLDPIRTSTSTLLRSPWLCSDESRDPEKTTQLLSSFFSQLSIRAFEGNYSLQKVDLKACRRDLIADLFAEQ